MSRTQRKQHAATHHTQPAAIAMLSDAFRVEPHTVLDALRSRFPGIIPESSASDVLAIQVEGSGIVFTYPDEDEGTCMGCKVDAPAPGQVLCVECIASRTADARKAS